MNIFIANGWKSKSNYRHINTTIVLLVFHVSQGIDTITNTGKSEFDKLKYAPVYMVQKDSAGKSDTMLMKDYLPAKDSIDLPK